MRGGASIPGAVLRNGEPSLSIRVNNQDVKDHAA
jgi:hypothetical protein